MSQIICKGILAEAETEEFGMSYDDFKERVNALIKRAGGGIKVWFTSDSEHGKHYANCSDGTVIIGSNVCMKVTVRWNGRNHQSVVAI